MGHKGDKVVVVPISDAVVEISAVMIKIAYAAVAQRTMVGVAWPVNLACFAKPRFPGAREED